MPRRSSPTPTAASAGPTFSELVASLKPELVGAMSLSSFAFFGDLANLGKRSKLFVAGLPFEPSKYEVKAWCASDGRVGAVSLLRRGKVAGLEELKLLTLKNGVGALWSRDELIKEAGGVPSDALAPLDKDRRWLFLPLGLGIAAVRLGAQRTRVRLFTAQDAKAGSLGFLVVPT